MSDLLYLSLAALLFAGAFAAVPFLAALDRPHPADEQLDDTADERDQL
jgi:hypothetical protein